MMFLDERAEIDIANQRLQQTRQELAAHRIAMSGRSTGLGALLDGALVRASQGALRRQEARRSRSDHSAYPKPDPAA